MFRRMFRRIGWMTAATFSWQHRGSVLRMFDLLRRLPALVSSRRAAAAVTEARLIAALDRTAPERMDIRITGIRDGDVVLRGDVPPDALELARRSMLGVARIVDVRSDAFARPTRDGAIPVSAAARG
jgi:hypothetical protein